MATSTATGSGAQTPLSFAEAVIAAMGWPETKSNIDAMEAWEQAEGGNWKNNAAANPLDTTLPESGSYSINSAGVQSYTGWPEGIAATVATLKENQRGYASIRTAFESGKAAQYLPAALNASAWGTNGSLVAKILKDRGYTQYGNITSGGTASGSSSGSSGCAFGIGPFCIFSESGLQKFYGALLMGAGGLVLTVGLGLVVIGALAETKLGKTTTQAFGSAGMGKLVGAAAAPSRAVSGRRQRRQASEAQAASQAASQQESERRRLSRQQIDRARVRRERARAREAEAKARRSSGTAAPAGFTQTEWNRLRREGRVSVKAS